MKLLGLIAVSLISGSAFASFYEECEFMVTPGAVQQVAVLEGETQSYIRVMPVEIYAAVALGGHTDCQGHLNKTRMVQLKNDEVYPEGEALTLKYSHMNSDTPTGYRFSESWSVIKEGGLIRMYCSQVDRTLPRYEVFLRAPNVFTPAIGTFYNVIVKQDDVTLTQSVATQVDIDAQVGSLHSVELKDGTLFKYRFEENVRTLNAELKLPDGLKKRMSCLVYE
jgi:hypothetical protein